MFTKYQIALQYSPELVNNTPLAVRRLRIMINRCLDLKKALDYTGCKRYSKSYTELQVKMIYYFLGEPPIGEADTSYDEKYILSEKDCKFLSRFLTRRK